MATSINDLFGQLLEFQYRGIGFPVVEFTTDLRQDLVIHKFIDRDGAHVEGVGRAPLQITARIPFLNGIDRAPNENWQRPLYPLTWRRFFAACADKTSGPLQHPELGTLTVKCEVAHTRWAGNVRTGVFVDCTWIETDDTGADLSEALIGPSPISNLSSATAGLDFQLATLNPALVPQPFVPPANDSFTDFMQSVRSVVDQFTILKKQGAGALDNIIYQAQAVEDSLDQATNLTVFNWPLYQAAELAKSAAYDLKASLLNKGSRQILFFTVQKDSTMAQLAAQLGQQVVDFIMLNPGFMQTPCIPSGSVVRYYATAAAA